MNIQEQNRLGFDVSTGTGRFFQSFNASTGEVLPTRFYIAGIDDVNTALEKADIAAGILSKMQSERKAAFLRGIGDRILSLGDELVQTACKETGLPEARIISERGRTINQINLFAQLLEEGSWVEAVIETAQPERAPAPKPDIRKMLHGTGPVVVFSASNFPLAFSTAGGDTISALAAGNPVIVKAHPSHPATNALISGAIVTAARENNMPDGVFSTLYSNTYELGLGLVQHPSTKSVAFTGSFQGGMALYKAALQREEPIPVFAEMGSVNPVILLPESLGQNVGELAKTLAGSIAMGAGQFCTNPGLIAAADGDPLHELMEAMVGEVSGLQPQTMLNTPIWENYHKKRALALAEKGVGLFAGNNKELARGSVLPLLAKIKFKDFKVNPTLHEEIFGPFSLLVVCEDTGELEQFASLLKGQLTCSVFTGDGDLSAYRQLLDTLILKCGRLTFNGVPTGVEVCHAMQHGGPFPATTDARFTSVGTAAIKRFVRPVAYQDCPGDLLPAELQDNNPLNIWRQVNGQMTKEFIHT
jgi:2,5-dioxopentanoate dehydrogenase